MQPQPHTIMLPVESIHIGQRQRSHDPATDKHIAELADDIGRDGLLHAIAVNRDYELVAGWCRLNAIKTLQKEYYYASTPISPGFIPCVILHQQDERELFRVELMENLRRRNLTPMDQAKAITALHRMFQETHGTSWTEADTGKELNRLRSEDRSIQRSQAEVADSILIEQFANDPEVARAPSREEAVKVVKKRLAQEFMQGLGSLAKPLTRDLEIIHGDCLELLPRTPAEIYNGIITDPPYGIGADDFGDQTMVTGHQYADTEENALAVAEVILHQGFRICTENSHLYMFCDQRFFERLSTIAREAGWIPFASPLIWHKVNVGHAPWPGFFSRRYECVLFAMKGSRKLLKARSDVFEFPPEKDRLHAAQKPADLYKAFMELSFFPGETILDPCAGSGTIFRAAKTLNLRATGIEKSEQYYNICKSVIAGEGLSG